MKLLVLLLVLSASVVWADSGQNPAFTCGDAIYLPGAGPRNDFPIQSQSQNVSLTGLGLLKCNAVSVGCKMTARRIAFDVVQSVAGVQCEPGIYIRSGVSATRVARTGILDCSDSVVIAANGGTAIEADLLAPLDIQPNQEYLGCIAFSIRNTSSVQYEAPRAIPLFSALGVYSTYNADLPPMSGQVTELHAKFPAACVGSGDPWACCTGAGTGPTCDGIPATISVLTPTFTHGPMLKLAR